MRVLVSYEIPTYIGLDRKRDDEITEFAKSMGGKFVGSGSGFHERDLEFEFESSFQGEDFIKKCRVLGVIPDRIWKKI